MLMGDGEERNRLEELVKKKEIDGNVHFLGKRDDVPQLLASMDICVLPSLSEGLSNALLEYMQPESR